MGERDGGARGFLQRLVFQHTSENREKFLPMVARAEIFFCLQSRGPGQKAKKLELHQQGFGRARQQGYFIASENGMNRVICPIFEHD